MENITTHEPDIVNEDILADLVADFDGFLKERNWEGCNAIIDNLRDLKEYSKGMELAKRLTARKMTVPSDYGKSYEDGVHEGRKDIIRIVLEEEVKTGRKLPPADYGEEKWEKTKTPARNRAGMEYYATNHSDGRISPAFDTPAELNEWIKKNEVTDEVW